MVSKRNFWVALMLMTLVMLAGCSSQTTENSVSADEEQAPIHPVEIEQITKGTLSNDLNLSGHVMAGSHMAVLPMLTGEVKAVHVKNGDTVQRGDALFELDATDVELNIAQARAGLEAAQASLTSAKNMRDQSVKQAEMQVEQAKNTYNMISNAEDSSDVDLSEVPEELQAVFASLLGGSMPTEQDKQQAKSAVRQAEMGLEQAKSTDQIKAAEASVKQAQISVDMAEQQKTHAVVKAPMSGQVTGLDVSVGEMASPQAPLLQLVQMDSPVVEVNVNESQLPNLKEGQEVIVHIRSFNQTYEGKINYISLLPSEQSRSYPVEIELANPDGNLRVGMLAEVLIETGGDNEQVVAPVNAVIEQNNETFVYVTTDGTTVERRDISINGETAEWFGIESGLQEGEYVVVRGSHQLYDGALINIRNDINPSFEEQDDEEVEQEDLDDEEELSEEQSIENVERSSTKGN
ncbi:efflux RND transporter periplasmic adaptor subunit [Halalkalibacter alkaliphilus]|uniref:Efflux RND transporter periplasmic adaptor subunit n=1 Tax=Halalkalibacter alkaliphilus TaxID=2917993 RepID=A0A9X2A0U0_9BACI|nr:efflux RND transporter periplasmic adaptor subunit [Halalkalibacter alkaliphilus]MCL7746620.1 efflux RND transporter periplasmic adaptor subunit [Halalkalibacter alkaliphilus]